MFSNREADLFHYKKEHMLQKIILRFIIKSMKTGYKYRKYLTDDDYRRELQ